MKKTSTEQRRIEELEKQIKNWQESSKSNYTYTQKLLEERDALKETCIAEKLSRKAYKEEYKKHLENRTDRIKRLEKFIDDLKITIVALNKMLLLTDSENKKLKKEKLKK